MRLDSLTIALRPRNNWEAMDLGVAMARAHWKPLMLAWLACFLPVIVLVSSVLYAHPWAASLIVWWLKPMFDRVPLFILSRATFGPVPGLRETLKSILPIWLKSLPWELTLGRFNMSRSFDMPVRDLEGLRGKARRNRLQVLHGETRNSAVWLTMACANIEFAFALSQIALIAMLVPHDMHLGFLKQLLSPESSPWIQTASNAIYYVAVCLVEPFYVAAGFALYLNRRTVLEGWDIEINFRRMAERLQNDSVPARHSRLGVWMLPGLLAAALYYPPSPAWADPAPASPASQANPLEKPAASLPAQAPFSVSAARQRIAQVMAEQDFQTSHRETHWKYIGKTPDPNGKPKHPAWMEWLANMVRQAAPAIEALLWVLAIGLVVWLIARRKTWLPHGRKRLPLPEKTDSPLLFGLDIQPESLPADIAGEAWALWQANQPRAALSLLYRGALSHIVNQERIDLGPQDTEEDCLRRCRKRLAPETGAYFSRVTRAWQQIAYAARPIAPDVAQALCNDWARHFKGAA